MTREDTADAVIRDHVAWSFGAALIPIPIGDVLATTALQVDMVAKLAEIYDQRFSPAAGKTLITSVTGTMVRRLGASAIKAIPGVGWLIGGPAQLGLATASTYAIGHLFKGHFAAGGTLDTFNPDRVREAYEKYLEKGRGFVEEMRTQAEPPRSPHDVVDTLQKLAALRDAGDLTATEYQELKERLLVQPR